MNCLVSILFVLACIRVTTQESEKTSDVKGTININNQTDVIPDTKDIPIQPSPIPDHNTTTSSSTTSTTTTAKTTTTSPITTSKTTSTTPTTAPTTKGTTSQTTAKSTTQTTAKPAPPTNSTTVTPPVTSSVVPSTVKPTPEPQRRFDGPSFVGGIVLALGLVAIGFVAFKFYKARLEVNYHTL